MIYSTVNQKFNQKHDYIGQTEEFLFVPFCEIQS